MRYVVIFREEARENDAFPETELRQLVYRSHRLIFTVRDAEVHVLHIRHTARKDLGPFM